MQITDLEQEQQIVSTLVKKGHGLMGIYSYLRSKQLLDCFGDWVLVSFIYRTANRLGRCFKEITVVRTLHRCKDQEFQNVRTDSPYVQEICAKKFE